MLSVDFDCIYDLDLLPKHLEFPDPTKGHFTQQVLDLTGVDPWTLFIVHCKYGEVYISIGSARRSS